MKKRALAFLAWLGAFCVPVGFYLVFWSIVGPDAMNRMGYIFWLLSGPDDLTAAMRIAATRFFFLVVMPLVLGIVGLGWRAIWIRSRLPNP